MWEPYRHAEVAWYVRGALEARRIVGALAALSAALVVAGCGGGERQDENEPEGDYRVEVTEAQFPGDQKLAKPSTLTITVRNVDDKTIPNIAITVKGFEERLDDPDLADPERPVFAVNGEPQQIGGLPESRAQVPEGGETAYVDTWALGELRPGQSETFEWNVTAVEAGPYKLSYEVSAGLDGKAKAVDRAGRRPTGVFAGTISDEPPDARVADDGRTIERD
jgi:hypothetical protein